MNFPLNHSTPGNSLGFFLFQNTPKVFLNVTDKYYKSKKALKEAPMQYIMTVQNIGQVSEKLKELGLRPTENNSLLTVESNGRIFNLSVNGNRAQISERIFDGQGNSRHSRIKTWNGENPEVMWFK